MGKRCNCCNCGDNLDCFMGPRGPQGEPGSTGATGPPGPGGTLAYGGMYGPNVTVQPMNNTKVLFNVNSNSSGMVSDFQNAEIRLLTDGQYEISYSITTILFTGSVPSCGETFRIRINDQDIVPESEIQSFLRNDTGSVINKTETIGKTIQLRLNANDRIAFYVKEVFGNPIYSKPSIVVKKL